MPDPELFFPRTMNPTTVSTTTPPPVSPGTTLAARGLLLHADQENRTIALLAEESDGKRLAACWNVCLGTEMPPDIAPGTVAALVAAARAGLDYLQRTNPLEHGNPDLGRTWGALENALEPFNR